MIITLTEKERKKSESRHVSCSLSQINIATGVLPRQRRQEYYPQ